MTQLVNPRLIKQLKPFFVPWSYLSGVVTIDGETVFPQKTLTLDDGDNHDVVLPAGSTVVRIIGPTSAFSITGIAGGVVGRFLVLENNAGQAITIANQNVNSTDVNRIFTMTGGDILPGATAMITLVYTPSRWRVISARGSAGVF